MGNFLKRFPERDKTVMRMSVIFTPLNQIAVGISVGKRLSCRNGSAGLGGLASRRYAEIGTSPHTEVYSDPQTDIPLP